MTRTYLIAAAAFVASMPTIFVGSLPASAESERRVSVSPFHDVNNRAYNPKAGYYQANGNLTAAGKAVTAKYPNAQAPAVAPIQKVPVRH